MDERTEREIAALRLKLRAEIQSADRLVSGLVRALLRAHLGPPMRVATTTPVGVPIPRGDQQPPRDDDPIVVEVEVEVEVEVVVRRVTWHDDDGGHPAAARLQNAFDDYVAKNAIDAAWNPSTEFWITPDYDGAASFAEGLSDVQHQWHYLALAKPVESAGYQMNLEAASVDVLAGIAAEFALPGDTSIKNIKRIVQFTVIAVGVASGQPLLANAGFKSWLHDFVTGAASKALKHTFTNTKPDVHQRVDEDLAQIDANLAMDEPEAASKALKGKSKSEKKLAFADEQLDEQDWKQQFAEWAKDSDQQQVWERRSDPQQFDEQDSEGRRREEHWWAADDRAVERDADGSGA